MDPHVNVQIRDETSREAFRRRMTGLRVGGAGVTWSEDDGFFALEFGQADDAIGDVTVDGDVRAPESLGFEIIEIEDEVASTGYHVPEGILITYDPTVGASVDRSRSTVATTEIAPMVLDRLGVATGERAGSQ